MTQRKLVSLMRQGRGQGHGESYQPWIRVRRNLGSPVSNLFVLHTPLYASRGLHLLSGIERSAALVLLWVGATEVREQFPMWPEAHPAPDFCVAGSRVNSTPGLLEIAKSAGIRHGVYPGTSIPYVGTIDLMATVGPVSGRRLIAVSCKPTDKLTGDQTKRVVQRLELERLYSRELGATWILFHEESIPKQLATNLDWFMPTCSELAEFRSSTRLVEFAEAFNRNVEHDSISVCRERAAQTVSLPDVNTSHAHFRAAVWLGLIDLDLTRQIRMSKPVVRDKTKFKASLIDKLTSETEKCRSRVTA